MVANWSPKPKDKVRFLGRVLKNAYIISMDKKFNISISNIIWIVTLIFAAGGAYIKMEYQAQKIIELETKITTQWGMINAKSSKEEVKIVEERLSKKIREINNHDDRIDDIELYISWEKGRNSINSDSK